MHRVLWLLLGLGLVASGQEPPPQPATPVEVGAGTRRDVYVSPWSAAQAGLASPTGGVSFAVASNIARTISGTNNTTGNAGTSTLATNAVGALIATQLVRGSILEALNTVYIGRTKSAVIRNISTNIIFYSAGIGVLRELHYTSENLGTGISVADTLSQRTNYSLRVYTDFPATNNFVGIATNYLKVNAPLATLLHARWVANMPARVGSPPYYACRVNTDLHEVYDVRGYDDQAGLVEPFDAFHMIVKAPMPYSNIVAMLWDDTLNAPFTNMGYNFVRYEEGDLPSELLGYRLKTQFYGANYSSGWTGFPMATNITGPGELVAVMADFASPTRNLTTASFLENQWTYRADTFDGDFTTGGEDLFKNGYYFRLNLAGVFRNTGTPLLCANPLYVSCYRIFKSDSLRWNTSAAWWYRYSPPVGQNGHAVQAHILSWYYNKP